MVYTKTTYETTPTVATEQDRTQVLEERKKVLAGLSFRFGNKQNVNELENEPAYKRKGVEVGTQNDFSSQSDASRYSLSTDAFDRPEIKKNNSYLHDNVD